MAWSSVAALVAALLVASAWSVGAAAAYQTFSAWLSSTTCSGDADQISYAAVTTCTVSPGCLLSGTGSIAEACVASFTLPTSGLYAVEATAATCGGTVQNAGLTRSGACLITGSGNTSAYWTCNVDGSSSYSSCTDTACSVGCTSVSYPAGFCVSGTSIYCSNNGIVPTAPPTPAPTPGFLFNEMWGSSSTCGGDPDTLTGNYTSLCTPQSCSPSQGSSTSIAATCLPNLDFPFQSTYVVIVEFPGNTCNQPISAATSVNAIKSGYCTATGSTSSYYACSNGGIDFVACSSSDCTSGCLSEGSVNNNFCGVGGGTATEIYCYGPNTTGPAFTGYETLVTDFPPVPTTNPVAAKQDCAALDGATLRSGWLVTASVDSVAQVCCVERGTALSDNTVCQTGCDGGIFSTSGFVHAGDGYCYQRCFTEATTLTFSGGIQFANPVSLNDVVLNSDLYGLSFNVECPLNGNPTATYVAGAYDQTQLVIGYGLELSSEDCQGNVTVVCSGIGTVQSDGQCTMNRCGAATPFYLYPNTQANVPPTTGQACYFNCFGATTLCIAFEYDNIVSFTAFAYQASNIDGCRVDICDNVGATAYSYGGGPITKCPITH